MLLGGGYHGQRLNKIYRGQFVLGPLNHRPISPLYFVLETVTEPEILAILEPMIKHYALNRLQGEHFGDFVIRAGYITPTESGLTWYEGMGGQGQHREVASH